MEKEHIVRAYDNDLQQITQKVMDLGDACINQLNNAIEALTNRDIELAKKTIALDENVNELQQQVDEASVKLLAMRSPVAGDLRVVISGLRISTDLERVADYASNIAKMLVDLGDTPLEHSIQLLIQMCELALEMLKQALKAYQDRDTELAIKVWHDDSKIDKTYSALLDQLRSCMTEDKKSVDDCTQLIFGARCIERMGDRITNVVESVYYMETGENYHGVKEK